MTKLACVRQLFLPQVLKTKNVPEILKQHDIGIKAIRAKFEECSAADTDSNVSDAVVNLASAAPIAVAMETVATREERWIDFVNFLNGLNPDMGNTISRLVSNVIILPLCKLREKNNNIIALILYTYKRREHRAIVLALESQVKHDLRWSPHGWVTVMW